VACAEWAVALPNHAKTAVETPVEAQIRHCERVLVGPGLKLTSKLVSERS